MLSGFSVSSAEFTHVASGLNTGSVKLDAVITAMPTVLRSIRDGYPLKIIGGPLFLEPLAVAIDKGDREFNARLRQIIGAMHRDGTLSRLSRRWYDADLTQ